MFAKDTETMLLYLKLAREEWKKNNLKASYLALIFALAYPATIIIMLAVYAFGLRAFFDVFIIKSVATPSLAQFALATFFIIYSIKYAAGGKK